MTLTYQRFTAVLLLIYGSLFLSGIYYCLRVFWCAAEKMSEIELEQQMNIKFLVKLGKSGNESRELLVQVYKIVYQCGVSLFWPTFQTFPAECQCSACRCITAYLLCRCEFQASTCMSSPSICAHCK